MSMVTAGWSFGFCPPRVARVLDEMLQKLAHPRKPSCPMSFTHHKRRTFNNQGGANKQADEFFANHVQRSSQPREKETTLLMPQA